MNASSTPGIWERQITKHSKLELDDHLNKVTFTDDRPNRSTLTITYTRPIKISDIAIAERSFLRAQRRRTKADKLFCNAIKKRAPRRATL